MVIAIIRVDYVILELNTQATVVCKCEVFSPKFKDERENGMMHTQNLDRSRFRFITEQTELLPGVFLFPSIDIINQEDTHFERFWVQQEDGCKIPDTFQDELAMVLVEPEGFSVLSACSHRGITNILRTVQAAFPESPCKLLLGGFHIHNAEKQKYQVIADYLQEYLPDRLAFVIVREWINMPSFTKTLVTAHFIITREN